MAERIDLERLTVPQLRELITQAESKLREKQERAKADLLAKWKAEAEENGLSLDTLLSSASSQISNPQRKSTNRIVPAKYRGPNGEEWSGRGRMPKWLAAFEAEGRRREEFAIDSAS